MYKVWSQYLYPVWNKFCNQYRYWFQTNMWIFSKYILVSNRCIGIKQIYQYQADISVSNRCISIGIVLLQMYAFWRFLVPEIFPFLGSMRPEILQSLSNYFWAQTFLEDFWRQKLISFEDFFLIYLEPKIFKED